MKLTIFEMRLVQYSVLLASLVLVIPFMREGAVSYTVLAVLLIQSLFLLYIAKAFCEYITAFPEGSFIDYIASAYGRGTSFVAAVLLVFSSYLFWISKILESLSFLDYRTRVFYLIIILTVFHLALILSTRYSLYFIFPVGIIVLVFVLVIVGLGVLNFYTNLPLTSQFSTGTGIMGLFSLFLGSLLFLPLTFFSKDTEDVEEEMSSFLIPFGMKTVFLIPIFLLIFLGITRSFGDPWSFVYSAISKTYLGGAMNVVFEYAYFIAVFCIFLYWITALSKIYYYLARSGIFFRFVGKENSIFSTPERSILVQFIAMLAMIKLALLYQHRLVMQYFIFTMVLLLIFVVFGIFVLRLRRPHLERPYLLEHWKIPSFLFLGYGLTVLYLWVQRTGNGLEFLVINACIAIISLPVYYLFEHYYNENMSTKTTDFFSKFSGIFQSFFFPMWLRKHMIDSLGDIKGKTVMDFGCSIGNLSILLLERVGMKGRIYATDKSRKSLQRFKRRLESSNYLSEGFRIRLIKDSPSSVSPEVPDVDAVVSYGYLTTFKDVDQVIKELNLVMKKNAKIAFVDYDKIFYIWPNKWLSSNRKIREFFDRNGFGVDIQRKFGFFCQYVIITGIKFKNAYYLDSWYEKKDTY